MGYFKEAKKAKEVKPKPTAKRCFIWCSRCHTEPRRPPENINHDRTMYDRWCRGCYADAPLTARFRKCSRREHNQIRARKEKKAAELAKERVEVLRIKLERAEQAKANKKANPVQPKRKKKGTAEPFSLAFDEEFLTDYWSDDEDATGERLEASYDRMRRKIAKVSDPTIYQDAAELVRDN